MTRKILLIASLALIISFSSAYAESISVEINDKSHEIEYTPFKLTVTGVEADIDFGSLIFSVNVVEDNASLKIVFDRILLDSKYQGQDGDYFVLADGEEVEFTEKKTTTQRTLTFGVEMGTEEIEVIGSHIAGIAIFESTVSTPITEDVEKEAAEKAAAEKAAAEKAAAEKAADSEQKLIDACGVGTVYQDGECVLSPQLRETDATKSMSFILPIVVAFGIAMGVLLVLWGIGKRSNKELED